MCGWVQQGVAADLLASLTAGRACSSASVGVQLVLVHSTVRSTTTSLPSIAPPAAPTLEVFFARQPPGTGIKSHTDYVNFVQTSHLGLVIPEGDCWYKVCGSGLAVSWAAVIDAPPM